MSDRTTFGIRIKVSPRFLEQESGPGTWVYAYTVRISNEGNENAQLMSRHWVIKDANDNVEEVRGAGVVGEQPKLEPGDFFMYTSYCPLNTPTGQMHGSYQMVTDEGEEFDAIIEPFYFAPPSSLN